MGKNRLPPNGHPPDDEGPLNIDNCLRSEDSAPQPLPPIVEPPAPRALSVCWICREPILSRADGLNLADEANEREFHIHHRCHERLWSQIPDAEKIKIRLAFQQAAVAGNLARVVGEVRQAILAFHSLVDLAQTEYQRRSPEEYGGGEN